MPNFERDQYRSGDDLDIATRVMDTVQRQIAAYRDALLMVRDLRQVVLDSRVVGTENIPDGALPISSAAVLAEIFEENEIPRQLARAMAAEDFQDASFLETHEAFWTWGCCCTDCCLTEIVIPDCVLTWMYPTSV
jgi:hypothetical protein